MMKKSEDTEVKLMQQLLIFDFEKLNDDFGKSQCSHLFMMLEEQIVAINQQIHMYIIQNQLFDTTNYSIRYFFSLIVSPACLKLLNHFFKNKDFYAKYTFIKFLIPESYYNM